MRFENCEQGSSEWLSLRREKITATDCAAIQKKSRYKSPRMVWLDKHGRSETVVNEAMERGSRLEPVARQYFNQKFRTAYMPQVIISDKYPWMMASLDGWDAGRKWILEIKCPGEEVFRQAQDGKFPEEYIWQVQHQIACSDGECELATLAFFYDGSRCIETVEAAIPLDEAMIAQLIEANEAFYRESVLGFKEPEFMRMDYEEREDHEWLVSCERWKISKRVLALAEVDEKNERLRLIELSKGRSTYGCGIQLTKYPRRGNVQYQMIPELQGIDLDQYRGPSTESWRITETKD